MSLRLLDPRPTSDPLPASEPWPANEHLWPALPCQFVRERCASIDLVIACPDTMAASLKQVLGFSGHRGLNALRTIP